MAGRKKNKIKNTPLKKGSSKGVSAAGSGSGAGAKRASGKGKGKGKRVPGRRAGTGSAGARFFGATKKISGKKSKKAKSSQKGRGAGGSGAGSSYRIVSKKSPKTNASSNGRAGSSKRGANASKKSPVKSTALAKGKAAGNTKHAKIAPNAKKHGLKPKSKKPGRTKTKTTPKFKRKGPKFPKTLIRKYLYKYFGKRLGYSSPNAIPQVDVDAVLEWFLAFNYKKLTVRLLRICVNEIFADRLKRKKITSSKVPFFPPDLLVPIPFWEIGEEYPQLIRQTSPDIKFWSTDVLGPGITITGGALITYEQYFQEFVWMCNQIMNEFQGQTEDILVTCEEPVLNHAHNQWEIEIIVIDNITGGKYFIGPSSSAPTGTGGAGGGAGAGTGGASPGSSGTGSSSGAGSSTDFAQDENAWNSTQNTMNTGDNNSDNSEFAQEFAQDEDAWNNAYKNQISNAINSEELNKIKKLNQAQLLQDAIKFKKDLGLDFQWELQQYKKLLQD